MKAQLEECGLELDQMREDQAAQVEASNQNRALYKNKVEGERKRTVLLQKEIASIETAMVNTPGYQKIFELEGERKNYAKLLQAQQDDITQLQAVHRKHGKLLHKEEKDQNALQLKADEYRLQTEHLEREVKQHSKELYEWQKRSIQTNMELDRWKEKNQELLVVIQAVKRDPRVAEDINSSRTARREPKQIYKETLREDRQRQAMHQETEDIEKKMAKMEQELRMLHAEGEVLDQASL